MGATESGTAQSPYELSQFSTEQFIHSICKNTDEDDSSLPLLDVAFSMDPRELMLLLIMHPDVVSDIPAALGYLISHGNEPTQLEKLRQLFNDFETGNKLMKQRLMVLPTPPLPETSVELNDPNMMLNLCTNLYALLQNICDNDPVGSFTEAIEAIEVAPNMVPPRAEYLIDDPAFYGVLAANSICTRGLVSNGNFLFALSTDMIVNVFPMLENGSLLAPFSHALNIETCSDVSLSVTNDSLVVSTNDSQYMFSLQDVTTPSSERITVRNMRRLVSSLTFSDGVVNVVIEPSLEASISYTGGKSSIYQAKLKKGSAQLDEVMPTLDGLLGELKKNPVEVNGAFLTVYIPLGEGRILAREFSLLNGSHVGDEVIELNQTLESICHDSMHNIHWVAVKSNGRCMIRAYHTVGCINPFIFNFSPVHITDISTCSIHVRYVVNKLTMLLLSSVMNNVPKCFTLTESRSVATVISLLVNLLETSRDFAARPKEDYNLYYYVLQIFVLLTGLNAHIFVSASPDHSAYMKNQIIILVKKMSEYFDSKYILEFAGFLIARFAPYLDCASITNIVVSVVERSDPSMFRYLIQRLSTTSALAAISFNEKNMMSNCVLTPKNTLTNGIKTLLVTHQKVLISDVIAFMKKDVFSSVKIFNDASNKNTPLDYFGNYMQALVNKLTSVFSETESYEEMVSSSVFYLFDNFITLCWGLSEYHAVAQILIPMIMLIPGALKSFLVRKNENISGPMSPMKLIRKLGFTFGLFSGTLIKGGGLSEFEEKNKWLIRPNMELAEHPEVLERMLSNADDFDDDFYESFFKPDNKIMEIIYKKWKPNMNRNVKGELAHLDKLTLAALVQQLGLRDELMAVKDAVDAHLRSALDQMLRIRNTARENMRSNTSNEGFFTRARMLIRMKTNLQGYENKPKVLGDFILSNDSPESVIHFIKNQIIRLKLTSIGFSFLESISRDSIYPEFYDAVNAALARIENFDGLAAIMRCSQGHSEKFIIPFIKKVIQSDSSSLFLITQKLFSSGVVTNDQIGEIIQPIVASMRENMSLKAFAMSYGRVGFIPNIWEMLTDINTFKIMEWHLVIDALKVAQCPPVFYRNCMRKALSYVGHMTHIIVHALFQCMQKVRVDTRELADDIGEILAHIGSNIKASRALDQTSELIYLIRNLLMAENRASEICTMVIESTRTTDSEERICGVFAVLGGFHEILKSNGKVSWYDNQGRLLSGIRFSNNSIYELPVTQETVSKLVSVQELYPEPTVAFTTSMFPKPGFVMAFFDVATKNIYSPLASTYLISLYQYLDDGGLVETIDASFVQKAMRVLTPIMNPIENIRDNERSMYQELTKNTTNELSGFTLLTTRTGSVSSYVSPVLSDVGEATVRIRTSTTFSGYVGLIGDDFHDCPMYLFIQIPTGVVSPGDKIIRPITASDYLEFRVDLAKKHLRIAGHVCSLTTEKKCPMTNTRIVIGLSRPIQLLDLTVSAGIYADNAHPVLKAIGFNESLARNCKLFSFPDWARFKDEFKAKMKLRNTRILPEFHNVVETPTIPLTANHPLPVHFRDSETTSDSLKVWVCEHYSAMLFSQWATAVVMQLVTRGCIKLCKASARMRLFSLLTVALDPCKKASLKSGEFPFSLENSPMAESSQINDLNYGMETIAQKTLQIIAQQDNFEDILKERIKQLHASHDVHLLTKPSCRVEYRRKNSTWPQRISVNHDSDYGMIALTPAFNSVLEIAKHMPRFPLVFCDPTSIAPTGNYAFSLLAVPISKHGNTWIHGTSLETMLLLKEYMLIGRDIAFSRRILIESVVVQSPLIWPYLGQLMIHASKKFITTCDTTPELIASMIIFGSFVNKYQDSLPPEITSIFVQEKTYLTSSLPATLAPYFPEMVHGASTVPTSNSDVLLCIPQLNIQIDVIGKNDALGIFLQCQTLTAKKSLIGYPFWEALPIWIALSNHCRRLEMVPPTVHYVSLDRVRIENPSRSNCVATIRPKTSVNNDAMIVWASNEQFANESMMYFEDQKLTISFSDEVLFLTCIEVPGNFASLTIDVAHINSSDSGPAVGEVRINPVSIHDEFIRDIRDLVERWTPRHTAMLLSILPVYILTQKEFEAVAECALSGPLSREFSNMAILFVTYLIHRFNYLKKYHESQIYSGLWKSVSQYLSSEEDMREFLGSMSRSDQQLSITIDRHKAHRIVINGETNTFGSVIGQFAEAIRSTPQQRLRSLELPWRVTFVGEDAIDVGGPGRELFNEIAQSIFEPTSNLFIQAPNAKYHCGSFRDVFVPCTTSTMIVSNARYYAIGVFIGIVIRTGLSQTLPFAPFVWKFLANDVLTEDDIVMVDNRLSTLFQRLRSSRNDVDFTSRFSLRWTVEDWDGSTATLKRRGGFVTPDEVPEYIRLAVRHRIDSVTSHLVQIKRGFNDNIGFSEHRVMTSSLLSVLAQGSNVITTEHLKRITKFNSQLPTRSQTDLVTRYFWEAVTRMTNEQRSLLLKFATSLTRLPNPNAGLGNGEFKLDVCILYEGDDTRLPRAATCFNKLYLPPYSSADVTYQKLVYAIEICQTMENA